MLKTSLGIENETKGRRWWKVSLFDDETASKKFFAGEGEGAAGTSKAAVLLMGDENRPSVASWLFVPPDVVTPAHSHDCDVVQVVLQGTMKVGNTEFGPGDVRIVPKGVAYGPSVSGPEGYLTMAFFSDAQGMPNTFVREKDRIKYAEEQEVVRRLANGDFSVFASSDGSPPDAVADDTTADRELTR